LGKTLTTKYEMLTFGGAPEVLESGNYSGQLFLTERDGVPLAFRLHFEDSGKISGEGTESFRESEEGKKTTTRVTGTHTKGPTVGFNFESDGIVYVGFKKPDGQLAGKWKVKENAARKGLFTLSLASAHEDKVATLVAMGFEEAISRRAVVDLRLSLEEAAHILSTGGASALPSVPREPPKPAAQQPPAAPTMEANIKTLVAMGFAPDAAKIALQLNGNSIEKAMQALTD